MDTETTEHLHQAIAEAKESIAHVEALLANMRENGALSFAEYVALEQPLRFARSNILNVE